MADNEKITIQRRMKQKTDTAANWAKAQNFIPLKGEIINFQEDDSTLTKQKIGNGVTSIDNLPFMYDNKAEGFSSKYTITTSNGTIAYKPGWYRVLMAIRGTPGSLHLVFGGTSNICSVSFNFNGFVEYKECSISDKPSIFQTNALFLRGDKNTWNQDVSDMSYWSKITKIRVGYPKQPEGESFNPINCFVDVYLDFDENVKATRSFLCQANLATSQHNMELINSPLSEFEYDLTKATDAKGQPLLGAAGYFHPTSTDWTRESELDFYTIPVDYSMAAYQPNTSLNNKNIYTENLFIKEKKTNNSLFSGNLGNEPINISLSLTSTGTKNYNFFRKYNTLIHSVPLDNYYGLDIGMSKSGVIKINGALTASTTGGPRFIPFFNNKYNKIVLPVGTYKTNLRLFFGDGTNVGNFDTNTTFELTAPTEIIQARIELPRATVYENFENKKIIPYICPITKGNVIFEINQDDNIIIKDSTEYNIKEIIIDNYNNFYSSKYLNDSYAFTNNFAEIDFITGRIRKIDEEVLTEFTTNPVYYMNQNMPSENADITVSNVVYNEEDNFTTIYFVEGYECSDNGYREDFMDLVGEVLTVRWVGEGYLIKKTESYDDSTNNIANKYLIYRTNTENYYDTFVVADCEDINIDTFEYVSSNASIASDIANINADIEDIYGEIDNLQEG